MDTLEKLLDSMRGHVELEALLQPAPAQPRAKTLECRHAGHGDDQLLAKDFIAGEIGIFSRQCLGSRRIPDLDTLRREVKAWNRRVNRDRAKIAWKFDRKTARRKFRYKRKLSTRSET